MCSVLIIVVNRAGGIQQSGREGYCIGAIQIKKLRSYADTILLELLSFLVVFFKAASTAVVSVQSAR